jgi:hypothetical protein
MPPPPPLLLEEEEEEEGQCSSHAYGKKIFF